MRPRIGKTLGSCGLALLALVSLPSCRRKAPAPRARVQGDQIIRTGPMVDGRFDPRVADLGAGHFLILSGSYLSTDADTDSSGSAEVYSEAGDLFIEVGSPAVPRISQALCALPGGDALVAGGWAREQVLDSVERYRGATASFELLGGHLSVPRSGGNLLALPDGRVLLWGGRGKDQKPLDALEWVDPTTGWSWAAGKLAEPRAAGAQATVLADGSVLFTGGEKADGATLSHAERFDPRNGRTTVLPALRYARRGHAAVRLADGRVLLLGGEVRDPKTGKVTVEAQVESFDPGRGTFQVIGTLSSARSRFAWALLPGGTVFLAGGLGGPGEPAPMDRTERFDPVTGQGTPGPTLFHPRSDAVALPLKDGRVVILGSGLEVAERLQ